MRNLQEQVKKAFCYKKVFWAFTVWINSSSDLKTFSNSRPSASQSLEHLFLTVGQNNFGNKNTITLGAKIVTKIKYLVTTNGVFGMGHWNRNHFYLFAFKHVCHLTPNFNDFMRHIFAVIFLRLWQYRLGSSLVKDAKFERFWAKN